MAVVRSTVWMRLCGVGLVVLCLSVNTGRGSFQEVADFQGLSLGNVDGQDGWVAAGTSSAVVVDPADGDNQVHCDRGAVEFGAPFFADGFESNDTTGWSNTTP